MKINLKGKILILDKEDYISLYKEHSWYLKPSGSNFYVIRTIRYGIRSENKKMRVLLHRIVVSAKKGEVVDHINGNTLDNRKRNLRICTQHQNMMNNKGGNLKKGKYKGVYKNNTNVI